MMLIKQVGLATCISVLNLRLGIFQARDRSNAQNPAS